MTRLGVTRVGGKIDVVGETLHWGIYEAFQRHQRGEGTRYERETLRLMMVTDETRLSGDVDRSFRWDWPGSTRRGSTIKSTRRRLRAWHRDSPGGTVNSDRPAE